MGMHVSRGLKAGTSMLPFPVSAAQGLSHNKYLSMNEGHIGEKEKTD